MFRSVKKYNQSRKAHTVDELDDNFQDAMFVGMLDRDNKTSCDWPESLLINNTEVKFQLDTGGKCNVMSYKTFMSLNYKTD